MSGVYAVWAALTAIGLCIRTGRGDFDGMYKAELTGWLAGYGIELILLIVAAVLL